MPLRLPSYFPGTGKGKSGLYAILYRADASTYSIELAYTPDCEGGNACHYGTVSGSSGTIDEDEGTKVPVTLLGGIKGHFIDSECGAHCSDSSIGWTENGFNYSISIKAETKENLIKVANSAIAASHKSAAHPTARIEGCGFRLPAPPPYRTATI